MAKNQCNFPASLDTLNVDRQKGHDVTSDSYDIIETAVTELEKKVGADSSAVTTSHDYKIAALESAPPSHAASHKGGGADAIDAATTSVSGLLSSTDKTKLDGAANLATAQAWTKAQTGTPVTLTDGANIAVDASAGNNYRVTLEGNRTLDNPTNLTDGWTFNIMVKQDAVASRTLAYGNKYAWAGGAPTLTTTASARDQITGIYWSTEDIIVCTIMKDVKVPS